ncbi:Ribosomal protein lysine methyltransferase [Coemansia spiralis]|uniref:Ribosomal protein lysine methyltransferase n=2 Tax=Coemansia TaxID=4863 RepID=A0A9W8KVB7_9FUNG|nr:putative methyltransferase-domain-containing protein [Coemansia spiralis]KAJ1989729.1 Ribosomal protein lysine methyltransferase [Coemansia umbellata]KAJ2620536.1 Ribosomal protein lysine methyltransferase [Coemansia sp. RSA 1358]KAJ2673420.1 Ribosomal protein lysine methyltransferase [Coemansia spiralis]
MNAEKTIFKQILSEIEEYISITDAEEEVCDLYSVYYSSGDKKRPSMVDSKLTEIEVEIKGSKRALNLSIIQNPNINGELGQTGGVLWSSSVIMSEVFAQRSSVAGDGRWDISQTNVVELGSGCGLVGLVLHQLGARRVVLTDQLRMMKVLNKNVEKCRITPNKKQKKIAAVDPVLFATEYLWGKPLEDMAITKEPIDMVVVSDCVYHEGIVPLLVKTLVDVCRSRTDGVPTAVVIGQELRSDLVHQAFVEALLSSFVVYRVPVSKKIDGFYTLYVAWLKEHTVDKQG